ncbi:MAG: cobalt ECF transporter T component CbiQ [Anaerolineae bacterium]|nr:MAG: cobalt ECF transporter T component CbiQ [Anaerolineae bacterium]
MHANPFDRYHAANSPLHHLEARPKVVATLLFVFSCLLLPDAAWMGFALSWGLVLALSVWSRLGVGYILKRSFVALPFALAAVTVLFHLPGEAVFTLHVGPWHLVASDAGVARFLSILARSWLSVQMAILLVATTPFPDLMHAMRHLHMPQVIVSIVAFMYRYLFVLADETLRLLRARESRSARLDGRTSGGSLRWRAQVAGNMAGQLFLRSYERSDRVYNAMLARGYQGELLTMHPHTLRPMDWWFGVGVTLFLLLVQWIGRW